MEFDLFFSQRRVERDVVRSMYVCMMRMKGTLGILSEPEFS